MGWHGAASADVPVLADPPLHAPQTLRGMRDQRGAAIDDPGLAGGIAILRKCQIRLSEICRFANASHGQSCRPRRGGICSRTPKGEPTVNMYVNPVGSFT